MTRDSKLWPILFYGGVVLIAILEALGQLTPTQAAALGLTPAVIFKIQVILGLLTVVGGKLGNSQLPGKPKDDRVSPSTMTRIFPVVLLTLLLPAVAGAQTLRASIAPTVRAYVLEQAAQPGTADAAVSDTAMVAAEWTFIASQTVHVAYAAVRQNQNAESVTQTVIVGITSTAGTLALARLLPARWQRFCALLAVGVATGIIDGRKIVQDVQAAARTK